ncbi:sensor histidine kinase [Lishizhenia tianjinensis]|uniref:sensor histidine kinase n=1 Tax=Lishizhenia tianjinensis TaxID=477690 RepID=UPI00147D210F|nr:histidine kinase [Lishizhenia tianjinensis]
MSEQLNLPSLETYKIKQDSKGNIWILSDAGVIQYDGNTSKIFTAKDGLTNSTIFDMYEDQFGRIWFLGMSLELCYFHEGKIHSYRYNQLLKQRLKNKVRIWKEIYVDSNDAVYYSINGAGCHKITKEGDITKIKQKDGIEILEIEDHLMISCNMLKDNYRVGKNLDTLKLDLYFKNQVKALLTPQVNSAIQPFQKIKGSNFSILYNTVFKEMEVVETESKSVYLTPYHDDILVATAGGFYIGKVTQSGITRSSPMVLRNDYITSILVDNQGAIWVSTLENGIFYFQDLNLQSSTYIEEETDKNIHKIFTFQNNLYALSYHHLFNLSTSTFLSTEANQEYCNYAILEDKLVLSKGGILHPYKTEFGYTLPFSRDLKVIDNKIFVSSSDRVYTIKPDQLKITPFFTPFDDSKITYSKKIALIDSSTILHSSLEKIRILKKHATLKEFSDAYNVQQMENIDRQQILILDKTKGLFSFNIETQEIQALNNINRLLPEVEFNCFYYEKNRNEYYIASNSGLFICRDSSIRIIDKNNGLSSNQINSLYYENNTLYFGVKGNVYRYHLSSNLPQQPIKSQKAKATLLTSDSNSIAIYEESNFSFPSGLKFLEFDLSTYSYSNWFHKQYQFRTDTSNTWISTNTPSFTLTNLNGKYQLEARYKIDAFTWSSPIQLAQITITPPWYKHWIMLVLYLISLGLIILLLVRFRLNRKMKKLQIQNNLLSYQQRLNNARIKPHFIFNVLNSINSHILFNENQQASNYLIKFSKLLRNLLEKSGDDIILIEHEVDLIQSFLNLEQIRNNNFEYTIDLPLNLKSLYIPSLMIQPFVENAVVHGLHAEKDQNIISISLKKQGSKTIQVSISNNSQMSLEQIEKWQKSKEGHAVHISKSRIVNYNRLFKRKDLSIELVPKDDNTEIILILPIIPNQKKNL